jgi:hypothetical protein
MNQKVATGAVRSICRTGCVLLALWNSPGNLALASDTQRAPTQHVTPVLLTLADKFKVILKAKRAFKRCGIQQKKLEPDRTGMLVMRWTILNSGRVEAPNCITTEFQNTYFATCAAEVIARLKFPAFQSDKPEAMELPFKIF